VIRQINNYERFEDELMKIINDLKNTKKINDVIDLMKLYFMRKSISYLDILKLMDKVKSIVNYIEIDEEKAIVQQINDIIDKYISNNIDLYYTTKYNPDPENRYINVMKSPKELVEIATVLSITYSMYFRTKIHFKFLNVIQRNCFLGKLWNTLYDSVLNSEPLENIYINIQKITNEYEDLSREDVLNHLGLTVVSDDIYTFNMTYLASIKDKLRLDIYNEIYSTYTNIQNMSY